MKRLAHKGALPLALVLACCAQKPVDCERAANDMLKAGAPKIEALAFFMSCVEKGRRP